MPVHLRSGAGEGGPAWEDRRVDRPAEARVTVRASTAADQPGVAALLAATADRVAALGPAGLGRRPGVGPALVAVDAGGTVRGHVRPVEHVLADDDPERTYAPDRSLAWSDAAFAGPDPVAAVLAVATTVRATGVGAEADGVFWPYGDQTAEAWWAAAGFTRSGNYCVRPPEPLPGPLPAGVTARTATPADLDQLTALHRESVAFQAAASPSVRLLPAAEAGFADRLRSGRSTSTVVAEGDRLLGVCEWWIADGGGEPDRPALLPAGRYAYMNAVAVTADARGRGLGRAVVAAALAAAGDGSAGSTLWCSPPNPIASRVWPHLGWRPIWSAWERRS
jgi:GNAT superfamily N-acetyltransferase